MAVTVGNWRWYTDASPDGSMTALAAENTAPVLTGAQTMAGIIRLRVQLVGDGSGGTVTLNGAHSQDGSNWRAWETSTGERGWVRWANGAATAGGTVGSLLLTGSTVAGTYIETSGQSVSVGANTTREMDLAIHPLWWGPDFTVLQQIRNGSTALAYAGGVPQIAATACNGTDRKHTIATAGMRGTGQTREVDFSCWPRMVHDGSYWWWICGEPTASTTELGLWRWDGTGGENGTWTKQTYTPGGTIVGLNEGDTRHAPNFRKIGGNQVLQVALRPTSGNLRLLRATFSGGTPTWTNVDLGRAAYNTGLYGFHAAIDAGGYHWVGGFDGTAGVWACRSTLADNGATFTPAFGTIDSRRKTLAQTITAYADGNPLALVGLGSDKALAVWVNGTTLRAASVTDASGFSASTTLMATMKNSHDWSAARSVDGAKVYVVGRNSEQLGGESGDQGGTWEFHIYDVAAGTWSQGPTPGHQRQNNNNDGVVVSVDATHVYAISSAVGPGGNQDRPVQRNIYTVASNTWDTYTIISPVQRGNGDDIAGATMVGDDGRVLVGYLWGDNDVSGHNFTFEYYAIDGDAGGGAVTTMERYNGTSMVPQQIDRYDGSGMVLTVTDKI